MFYILFWLLPALNRDMDKAAIVLAGYEPIAFQTIFPEWDFNMDARKANMMVNWLVAVNRYWNLMHGNTRIIFTDIGIP